jgi:DNA-binding transcriptional MocR family regulator
MTKFKNRNEQLKSALGSMAPVERVKEAASIRFAQRMTGVPRSFIREILKVAISPEVISFAGGLPSKELFPLEELQASASTNVVKDF